MARVRAENHPSSEREKVVVAATAKRIAGSAAITENNSTMRECRRAPGTRSRHARHSPIDCETITASMARIRPTLTASADQTTSLRGMIVVKPVRIR